MAANSYGSEPKWVLSDEGIREECLKATDAYRRAMVDAGLVKQGLTMQDFDRAVASLKKTEKQLRDTINTIRKKSLASRQELVTERNRLKMIAYRLTGEWLDLGDANCHQYAISGVQAAHKILAEVADKHGVTVEDIKSPRRNKECVRARQEAFYLIKHQTNLSLPSIGRICGGKDHTTVLYGVRAHQKRLDQ